LFPGDAGGGCRVIAPKREGKRGPENGENDRWGGRRCKKSRGKSNRKDVRKRKHGGGKEVAPDVAGVVLKNKKNVVCVEKQKKGEPNWGNATREKGKTNRNAKQSVLVRRKKKAAREEKAKG